MNQVCAAAASKTFDFFTNIRQAVEVLRRQHTGTVSQSKKVNRENMFTLAHIFLEKVKLTQKAIQIVLEKVKLTQTSAFRYFWRPPMH